MWGTKVKKLRKSLGLNQDDFCEETDLSQSTISATENSAFPELIYIDAVCKRANKELWEFFIDENKLDEKLGVSPGIKKIDTALRQIPNDIQRHELLNLIHQQILLYLKLVQSQK